MNSATAAAAAKVKSQRPSDIIVALAKFGYAAKGVVYCIIGVLALQMVFGTGGETTGSKGAIHQIASAPFGQFLLWAIGIGLFGYMVWRLVEAFADPDHHRSDAKGLARRAAFLFSAIAHGSLGFWAIRLALGASNGGGGSGAESWTAKLLSQPFGQWLVGVAGLAILVGAAGQLYGAYKAEFMEHLSGMSADSRDWIKRMGQWGYAARGIIFGIIGYFLIQAAWKASPDQAVGLEGALDKLLGQSYGPWIFGVVAAGLLLYGGFMLVESRYRTFTAH